jgi:Arc/MetJ-type ribon-helix-helix transcriptional regulator
METLIKSAGTSPPMIEVLREIIKTMCQSLAFSGKVRPRAKRKSCQVSNKPIARVLVGDDMRKDLIVKELQFQLEMDDASYALLKSLQTYWEATSASEVVRRAIHAYEIIEPVENLSAFNSMVPPRLDESRIKYTKRVHVRLPLRTKELLEKAKIEEGSTYSEIVRKALLVILQLVRDHEASVKEDPRVNGKGKEEDNQMDPTKLLAMC